MEWYAYIEQDDEVKKTKVLTPCLVQEEKLPPCPLQAKDLLNLTHLARGLGQSRYARISLENGRLHLYSLGASVPPRCAVTLQVGWSGPRTSSEYFSSRD
ncbi:hypothetical protein E2C01_058730 [Portunus trituberculatus]|uniref:Uncharacterized protein n=1 Tax=Portunus trituberculatus TaxID=210409 RepID=A0A5B7H0M0_PORTR|nr:hypothetical protein [Portunus trituberculatus]